MAKNGKKGILDYFKISDDDDEYDEDDDYAFDDDDDEEEFEEPVRKTRAPRTSRTAPAREKPQQPAAASYQPTQQRPQKNYDSGTSRFSQRATQTASDKLVSFDSSERAKRNPSAGEVYVIRPQEFDDAQTVVDFLKRNKAIVINMEGLQLEPAQRIIDFIGGACYGINGDLKAISANIFIAVPNTIEVSGDLREEILNSTNVSPLLGQ